MSFYIEIDDNFLSKMDNIIEEINDCLFFIPFLNKMDKIMELA
jgi:hypothetical protein